MFKNDEEKVEFMVEHDFGVAHAEILESQRHFSQAADLRLQEGDIIYAINLLVQDRDSSASAKRAGALVLEDLWRTLSFAVLRTNDNVERLRTLFDFVNQLGAEALSPSQRQEVRHIMMNCDIFTYWLNNQCLRSWTYLVPYTIRTFWHSKNTSFP